jgi:curved DNA-binding protein
MIFKDYYKILNLDTSRVTINEIKNAYREQAKKYHPDVNVGNKNCEERFKDINEAYKILSEPSSKKKYDRIWNRNIGSKNATYKHTPKGDFFTILFGNVNEEKETKVKEKLPAKGENLETEIKIRLEEAFRGVQKSISLRTVDGKMKTINVDVPPGIRHNEKIRIMGQGKPGKNGGKNGDLLIRVKIKNDNEFSLEGYNIRKLLYLSPWEAALGTKIKINGINEDISVYIPAGICSGEIISIDNKGYKDGKGGRGKLILEARILMPKEYTDKEKELFTELRKLSKFNPRKELT